MHGSKPAPGVADEPLIRSGHTVAVVFDWAGTLIDFGSRAPMASFEALFAQAGIAVSEADTRQPMGLPKWDHIWAMLQMPHIAEQWESVHGGAPSHADADHLFSAFAPLNRHAVASHAQLIPGALAVIAQLRDAGIRVGTTTGYSREVMQTVLPLVADQGFVPDLVVCADDLPTTRPTPLAMYWLAARMAVWPLDRMVKVDDTVPGLLEGARAGCATVGVMLSGNAAGLSQAEMDAIDEPSRDRLREVAIAELSPAKPTLLIDTVADLLAHID